MLSGNVSVIQFFYQHLCIILLEVHCLTGLLFYNCVITFMCILPEVYCLAGLPLDLLFVNSSQLLMYLVSGTLLFEMLIKFCIRGRLASCVAVPDLMNFLLLVLICNTRRLYSTLCQLVSGN